MFIKKEFNERIGKKVNPAIVDCLVLTIYRQDETIDNESTSWSASRAR
jgi:hypothetical protein